MKCFVFFLSVLFSVINLKAEVEKPIVVLITSYNNAKWVKENLESACCQEYTNYRVIYIDDASTDNTYTLVKEWLEENNTKLRVDVIHNTKRVGALANIYTAIHSFCEDEEIVASLDGDDWFPDPYVLKKVNKLYTNKEKEIWLTHGTFKEYPSGRTDWSQPVPRHLVIQNIFRRYKCPSHLRTFYTWLFKKIELEDLLYEGEFFSVTWDQAIMFPMIEMAGERHMFIEDIVYIYNQSNPISDSKVNTQLQIDLEAFIRAKKPYARLEHK